MTCFRSSRPDKWVHPRPYSDPSLRFMKHGPILPMVEECGRAGIAVRREAWGFAGGVILLAIAAFGATVALSPSATEPVPVSAHAGDGPLSHSTGEAG